MAEEYRTFTDIMMADNERLRQENKKLRGIIESAYNAFLNDPHTAHALLAKEID